MEKQNQLTFIKAEYSQFTFILRDDDINAKVSLFLLRYVSAEALYKKLLTYYKEQKKGKLSDKEKRNMSVIISEVRDVMAYFEIPADDSLLERIFGSNDKNYKECSIKKLRDRLVHNVNANVLRNILERYDCMMADLDSFSHLFVK